MIFVGDVGTKIILSVEETTDISSGTEQVINYRKPNCETGTWTATIEDNTLYYITQEGDIDQQGTWKLQGFVNLGAWEGCTTIANMSVFNKLV